MKDLCFNYLQPVMDLIHDENLRQLEKWGVQNHTPVMWLAITTEECGELAKAILEFEFGRGSSKDIVKEAVQVATLAIKIAEMFKVLSNYVDAEEELHKMEKEFHQNEENR